MESEELPQFIIQLYKSRFNERLYEEFKIFCQEQCEDPSCDLVTLRLLTRVVEEKIKRLKNSF